MSNDLTPTVCPHGGLRRQCEPCDLADRLEAAEQRIDELKGYMASIADLVNTWCREDSVKESPNDDPSNIMLALNRLWGDLGHQRVVLTQERDDARQQLAAERERRIVAEGDAADAAKWRGLKGEPWAKHIESAQVERLTKERDAERERADKAEADAAGVRERLLSVLRDLQDWMPNLPEWAEEAATVHLEQADNAALLAAGEERR